MASKMFIALDLEPMAELGEQAPLHVTLVPPVQAGINELWQVRDNLRSTVDHKGIGVVAVKGVDEGFMAPDSRGGLRQVRLVESTPELTYLHRLAVTTVVEAGLTLDTTWVGRQWTPHVIPKGEASLSKDEIRTVEALTIFNKAGNLWSRLAVVNLKKKA